MNQSKTKPKGVRYVRSLFFALLSCAPSQILYAQDNHIHLSLQSSVDTSNQTIGSVINLWERYLNSHPDSVYANPYWSEIEQRRYKPFDLAAYTWWGPNMYFGIRRWTPTVLSVSAADTAFIIRTMFYFPSPEHPHSLGVRNIVQTAARREGGEFKLCNVLPINTKSWHKEHLGSIIFTFPPEHVFDRALAQKTSRLVDSLADVWHIDTVPVDYYFADDIDRVAKALGFDYWPAEGNVSGPGGFTDVPNRIVYGGGSKEWYPHEFVHIYINPLFPNAHHYFLEGYATLVGGSAGHPLSWHLRRNFEYLKGHPNVDVLTFKGVDLHVLAQYFVGGLLCRMAEEKGGLPLIRKLMQYGKEDEDLYRAINEVFGVSKKDLNIFLRKKLAEYSIN